MPLAVTFADNTNGTGATATVTGSGGAGVSLRTARVTGDTWPSPVWSAPLTRTGDGTLAVPLRTGSYFGHARAGVEVTPPIWFGVTDPAELAVATRCRDAVAARLALLPLSGLKRIHQETFVESANKDFPCLVLSVDGQAEQEETGLDGLDLIGHPVLVSICDAGTHLRDRAKLRERYEPWRQKISDALRWQKIDGVSELYNHTTVEHLPVADPKLPAYQSLVSAMLVVCWVYRTRGI